MFGRLAMGFANVRAGTRVLKRGSTWRGAGVLLTRTSELGEAGVLRAKPAPPKTERANKKAKHAHKTDKAS